MSQLLERVANVLEKAAEYVDAIENNRVAEVRAAKEAKIQDLSDKYAAATGEDLPDSIKEKLATSDKDVLEFLRMTVEKNAGEVPALGGPSNTNDSKVPTTIKEAAAAADDRFIDWINS